MRFVSISIFVVIGFFILQGICFSDAEEGFPKIGFIKNAGANIRAGDNINFESLCKLEKGDPVKIIDRRYSWFKVMLPRKAHLYIKDNYVELSSEGETGIVNASGVNIRAGAGTGSSILSQVSKPEELIILDESDGWYKIEPPAGTAGWVHSSQISFSLNEAIRRADKID